MIAEELEDGCIVRRVFAWPVDVVYRAWTDPAMIRQWSWGKKFETIALEIDCRPGGAYRQQIRDKETGETWFFDAVIQEVIPLKSLVHTFYWRSDKGEHHGPSLVAIKFMPHPEGTEIIIRHTQLTSREEKKETEHGWVDVCDCITACLHAHDAALATHPS